MTLEETITISIKIEAMLNSRPLCALPSYLEECDVLTPGHFSVGGARGGCGPYAGLWPVTYVIKGTPARDGRSSHRCSRPGRSVRPVFWNVEVVAHARQLRCATLITDKLAHLDSYIAIIIRVA
ncbi:hypothetical protein EVAR_7059_1 [Eumeta japonica]|uniref:Uncharacterized protein n=1 Tax=Eumeta variegata TaxID=151549 RepID=A0A4C1X8E2_EUMVA|nr:hypothetical protein EVAR_7059_1 [Eumeta japonica]